MRILIPVHSRTFCGVLRTPYPDHCTQFLILSLCHILEAGSTQQSHVIDSDRTPSIVAAARNRFVQEDTKILVRIFADAFFLRDTGQNLPITFTDLNDSRALSMSSCNRGEFQSSEYIYCGKKLSKSGFSDATYNRYFQYHPLSSGVRSELLTPHLRLSSKSRHPRNVLKWRKLLPVIFIRRETSSSQCFDWQPIQRENLGSNLHSLHPSSIRLINFAIFLSCCIRSRSRRRS